MFKNQPFGLYVLSLANTGERFGYYTMLAIFLFYLQAKFGLSATWTGQIFSIFLALVYFFPVLGGWLADRWSFSKCVVTGIAVMFVGYALMAFPTPVRATGSMVMMLAALLFIAVGTGLFKGNLQVMVGDLYNEPRYAAKRDSAFSLFYMAINLGSMFAPMAAISLKNLALRGAGFLTDNSMAATVCNWCLDTNGFTSMPTDPDKLRLMTEFAVKNGMAEGGDTAAFLAQYLSDFAAQCTAPAESLTAFADSYITAFSTGCSYAFALACGSLIVSFLIYSLGRKSYAHIITDKKPEPKAGKAQEAPAAKLPELTPEQTKQRIVALFLVFGVVIFFWMVFHQNGQTLTEFAKSCTSPDSSSWTRIGFNIWALVAIAAGVYALFGVVQSATAKAKTVSGIILLACIALVWYIAADTPATVSGIDPAIDRQFHPCFVVARPPVS
ncbi:MAG: MFS transporter, partial [Duncaniella sp.]|nr:MFS transporter [Duncaniella sp.]